MNPQEFERLFSDWRREKIQNTAISRDTDVYNAVNAALVDLEQRIRAALKITAPAPAASARSSTDDKKTA